MSDKDDPFGSGGKTVIRPNPAGRPRSDPARQMPGPGGSPVGDGSIPGQASTFIGGLYRCRRRRRGRHPRLIPIRSNRRLRSTGRGRRPASSGGSPMPAANEAGKYGMPGHDDWMNSGNAASAFFPNTGPQQPAPQQAEKIPLEVALNARDGGEYSAANPITAAAAPLLILLGRLRLMIIDMQAVPLMNHVAQSIRDFERKLGEAGVPQEDAMVAKYALCGTADDIVQNLPGTDRHVWMQYSMLAQFFQVRTSGVGFFEELRKILANPAPRYDLLELMHACLSLGFEGQYRGAGGGDVELQRWRRDVYQTLRHLRTRNDDDISPHWRGMAKLFRNLGSQIPTWVIAGACGAVLVGIYFLLRFIISHDGDALAARLIALNPTTPVTIERAAFAPFKGPDVTTTTQLQRIRGALAEDIAGGGLDVKAVGDTIVVQVSNLLLFASGKADVRPEFEPIAIHIAAALDKEPGPINVVGIPTT